MSNEQMNPDIPNEFVRPSNAGQVFLFLIALAAIVAFVPWLAMKRGERFAVKVSPPIQAEGWLNGEAPTTESLEGKVVLMHAWATWCGPCRQFTPILVDLHEQYSNRGVVFVGLTNEESFELNAIKKYVEKAKISWLIGYGAGDTLANFGNRYLPTAYVIGADGMLLWNSENGGSIKEILDSALESAKARSPKE